MINNNIVLNIRDSITSSIVNFGFKDVRTLWENSSWRGRTVYVLIALATVTSVIAIIAYAVTPCFFRKPINRQPTPPLVKSTPQNLPLVANVLPQTNPPPPLVSEEPLKSIDPILTQKETENPLLPILDTLKEINTEETATQYILTTNGFEKEPHDYCDPSYGYRGEVQGNAMLRGVTACVTKKYPHAISPTALSKQKELNLEQYLIFTIRRFAHAHSFNGKIGLPSGKKMNLDGFCEAYTIPMIASSYQDYAKTSNFFTEEDQAWIVQQFNKTASSDLTAPEDIQALLLCAHDPKFTGPEAIGTGYDWHSTGTMFFAMKGKYLIYCNRNSQPGVHVIQIPDFNVISEKVIRQLCKRQEIKSNESFDIGQITRQFNGKVVHYEKMSCQKVGNCTYTSMKALLFSFMTIRYLMTQMADQLADSDKIEPAVWAQAFKDVTQEYKKWSEFDRKEVVFNPFIQEVEEELLMEKTEETNGLLKTYGEVLKIWWDKYSQNEKYDESTIEQVELLQHQISIALLPAES